MNKDKFQELLDSTRKMYDDAVERANTDFPKIVALKPIVIGSGVLVQSYSAFTRRDVWGSTRPMDTVEEIEGALQQYRTRYDEEIARIKSLHQENIPLIEHNKRVFEKVTFLMKEIGVPLEYSKSYYKTSRSRTMTTERVKSGWVEDMNRLCIRSDRSSLIINEIESNYRNLENKAKEEISKIRKLEQEKVKQENERIREMNRIRLTYAYGLPVESTESEIIEKIKDSDRYVGLWLAMIQTRNDWNEGFWLVEDALNSFSVMTPEDQEIYKNISEILESGENDGRIFRDCEWNYDRISQLVSEEVMKDIISIVDEI